MEGEVCLRGGLTEAIVSGRGILDPGEAGDGRSDGPLDEAMEMATAATPIAGESTGTTLLVPMERNEIGKWRTRTEALAPINSRSRMEMTMGQQAQELMQLHSSIRRLANLLEAQVAPEEAHWRG